MTDSGPNAKGSAARHFHAASSYARSDGEGLDAIKIGIAPNLAPAIWEQDWSIEPYPFKEYETLPPIELPREWPKSDVPALAAIARPEFRAVEIGAAEFGAAEFDDSGTTVPGLAELARIAIHANGLLNRSVPRRDGSIHQFRTAGGTGARYHLELYFICADLPGLSAGVYHYNARDHTFRCLRAGDFRSPIVAATGHEEAIAHAPVILAMTSTFWRNSWRYRERAYRHTFWDTGTVLSQVLGVAASAGLPAEVVLGYADDPVNAVLAVDGEHEATVALCALGHDPATVPAEKTPDVSALNLSTRAISAREEEFPEIPRAHAASALTSAAEAIAWRESGAELINSSSAPATGQLIPLAPTPAPIRDATVEELILDRRSVRHYDDATPTPFATFSALLRLPTAGFAADALPAAVRLHELFLIVSAVETLTPGLYRHRPENDAIELLREGDFRDDARRIAVNQEYPGDAHVNLYYLADLDRVLKTYGNRGYRLAQLESALYAGRLHLATHAYGCGAVGSTSYDSEVIDLFSPHADGLSYLFVTVFGKRRPPKNQREATSNR